MAVQDSGRQRTCREKNVDVCALDDNKYLVQASHGRFAKVNTLQADLSEEGILLLHKNCQNGEHYMARTYTEMGGTPSRDGPPKTTRFYIIKKKWCTEVSNLVTGSVCHTYELSEGCQGGAFYLANASGFFIIHSEDDTFLYTERLNSGYFLGRPQNLHPDYTGGLYYFATSDWFYVVKTHPVYGLVYYKTRSLTGGEKAIVPISESVIAFFQNKVQLGQSNSKGTSYPHDAYIILPCAH